MWAAAVHSEVPIIVTFDLRHFRSEHLEPWDISAIHPEVFLTEIFRQEESGVVTKLEQQLRIAGAACVNCSIS